MRLNFFFNDTVKTALHELRDLFFPRSCVVCGRFLETYERDLCADCMDELPLTYQWDIVQNAAFERMVRRCEVEAAASLFFFLEKSAVRNIVYAVKYGGQQQLGRRMGRLLGQQLASSRAFRDCQAVVPVPLHPLRHWKRGYNQAEAIARGVAAALDLPVETALLRRSRHTKTQTRLRGAAKSRNVQDAFRIDTRRAAQLQADGIRHLLLVDDVLTTGSTLAACIRPLNGAGFKASAATLAFAGS